MKNGVRGYKILRRKIFVLSIAVMLLISLLPAAMAVGDATYKSADDLETVLVRMWESYQYIRTDGTVVDASPQELSFMSDGTFIKVTSDATYQGTWTTSYGKLNQKYDASQDYKSFTKNIYVEYIADINMYFLYIVKSDGAKYVLSAEGEEKTASSNTSSSFLTDDNSNDSTSSQSTGTAQTSNEYLPAPETLTNGDIVYKSDGDLRTLLVGKWVSYTFIYTDGSSGTPEYQELTLGEDYSLDKWYSEKGGKITGTWSVADGEFVQKYDKPDSKGDDTLIKNITIEHDVSRNLYKLIYHKNNGEKYILSRQVTQKYTPPAVGSTNSASTAVADSNNVSGSTSSQSTGTAQTSNEYLPAPETLTNGDIVYKSDGDLKALLVGKWVSYTFIYADGTSGTPEYQELTLGEDYSLDKWYSEKGGKITGTWLAADGEFVQKYDKADSKGDDTLRKNITIEHDVSRNLYKLIYHKNNGEKYILSRQVTQKYTPPAVGSTNTGNNANNAAADTAATGAGTLSITGTWYYHQFYYANGSAGSLGNNTFKFNSDKTFTEWADDGTFSGTWSKSGSTITLTYNYADGTTEKFVYSAYIEYSSQTKTNLLTFKNGSGDILILSDGKVTSSSTSSSSNNNASDIIGGWEDTEYGSIMIVFDADGKFSVTNGNESVTGTYTYNKTSTGGTGTVTVSTGTYPFEYYGHSEDFVYMDGLYFARAVS